MSWWSKFDRFLSKVETKGFHFANKAHVYTINFILVGLAYGTYTLFRDYNEFFKAGRDPNYGRDLDELEDEQLGEPAHPSGATGRDRL